MVWMDLRIQSLFKGSKPPEFGLKTTWAVCCKGSIWPKQFTPKKFPLNELLPRGLPPEEHPPKDLPPNELPPKKLDTKELVLKKSVCSLVTVGWSVRIFSCIRTGRGPMSRFWPTVQYCGNKVVYHEVMFDMNWL